MSFENLSVLACSSSLNTFFFPNSSIFPHSILTTMRFFFPTLSYQSSVPMSYLICPYQLSERIRDSLESVAFWESSTIFCLLTPKHHDSWAQSWGDDSSARGGSGDERETQRRLELSLNHYWLCLFTAFSCPLLSLLQEGIHICARILLVSIGQD